MSADTKEGENPPQLKGEAPVEVAVLAVQDHDSDADADEIVPSPLRTSARAGWGSSGLMKSARSSIEQPRTWDDPEDRSPPASLAGASRSYHTSQWRNNTPINAVHVVDLNEPPPSAEALAAKAVPVAEELDASGERAHVYFASKHERVKAVLGIVGKDDLAEGEKRERVRIVCKSDDWTAAATIAQRFPTDQPFTLTVTSQHQQAFLVLPRSFRGVARLSTTYGAVCLSAAVGAAYTHVGKHVGFVGDAAGWSGEPDRAEDEGLDVCWGRSGSARVHVRFDDEPEELDPLEEAAREAAKAAKKVSQKVSSWWKSAVEKI